MDAEDRPGVWPAMATTIPVELGDDLKKPVLVETTTSNSDLEEKQDGEVIIRTAADAATHFLSMRDDFDPALTFRSIVLATGLAAFQAVMYQIYMVSYHFMFSICQADLIVPVVQTHHDHDPRNLHRRHRFLCGQGLVQDLPSW